MNTACRSQDPRNAMIFERLQFRANRGQTSVFGDSALYVHRHSTVHVVRYALYVAAILAEDRLKWRVVAVVNLQVLPGVPQDRERLSLDQTSMISSVVQSFSQIEGFVWFVHFVFTVAEIFETASSLVLLQGPQELIYQLCWVLSDSGTLAIDRISIVSILVRCDFEIQPGQMVRLVNSFLCWRFLNFLQYDLIVVLFWNSVSLLSLLGFQISGCIKPEV
jgi:hypothetical protein